MAAYKKARELGSPGIELDVHLCAPGKNGVPGTGDLVVAHDDTFLRTAPAGANGRGLPIEELGVGEIRTIDVGSFFNPRFSGERPPLLAEVLEEFCPAMYVDIELKTRKKRDDPLPRLVAELLKRMGPGIEKSVTISSFNPFSLRAFREHNAVTATAVIWCADPDVPWILRRGAGRFISHCDYVKPVYLQARSGPRAFEGRPRVPWTIDDPGLAEKMLSAGCAGIISNRPQDLLPLINSHSHG
jgi:glycerophosphoryl diester phosphodiesterase